MKVLGLQGIWKNLKKEFKAECINLRFIPNRILCPKTLCLRTALEVPWYSAATGGLKSSESLGLYAIFTEVVGFSKCVQERRCQLLRLCGVCFKFDYAKNDEIFLQNI